MLRSGNDAAQLEWRTGGWPRRGIATHFTALPSMTSLIVRNLQPSEVVTEPSSCCCTFRIPGRTHRSCMLCNSGSRDAQFAHTDQDPRLAQNGQLFPTTTSARRTHGRCAHRLRPKDDCKSQVRRLLKVNRLSSANVSSLTKTANAATVAVTLLSHHIMHNAQTWIMHGYCRGNFG